MWCNNWFVRYCIVIEIFKVKNIKSTKQRETIYNFVKNYSGESTIKIISENCCADKATIYRILELFLEKEIFIKKVDYDGQIYYMLNEHYHYVNCIKCHKRTRIDICPIKDIKVDNYTILNHNVELNGICNSCKGWTIKFFYV